MVAFFWLLFLKERSKGHEVLTMDLLSAEGTFLPLRQVSYNQIAACSQLPLNSASFLQCVKSLSSPYPVEKG